MPRAKAKKQEERAEVVTAPAEAPVIVSYKGFDKDLRCRGFQYEVGGTYEHKGHVAACESGFHACANPWDVLDYYSFVADDGSLNRFAEVEQSGDLARHSQDSKIASAVITIKAELKLSEFIGRAVQWVIDATKGKGDDPSGDSARIGSSGNDAQIDATGENAVIASAGKYTCAKGKIGTWISLAEFDDDGKCVGFATSCIGQDGLEPDTWYEAGDGKLVKSA